MKAATWPRAEPLAERLLHIDPASGELHDAQIADLPRFLAPGDVLVVNDAATLPASLHGTVHDQTIELRLLARLDSDDEWRALLFGAGDFRTPTEDRLAAPSLRPNDIIAFGAGLQATITHVDRESARLVQLRFDRSGAALWHALYAQGHPIQYAYVDRPLDLWLVQNRYAARPWAVELPSAGRPLTWGLLRALRRVGVELAAITHAAGISSTGSDALDRRLPLAERYAVAVDTVAAIRAARRRGGRVVAAGTTVVRALEACALAHGAELAPTAEAETTLVLGPRFELQVVNGLLTGMHPAGTSHFELLQAFAPRALLERANVYAEQSGYLQHEFGDSSLILPARQ
jgi:S-adenosylmethionine:tRNA ribosyltransferase-isomerase